MDRNYQIVKRQQLSGSNLLYEVDVGGVAVNEWEANAFFGAFAILRPPCGSETGFVYQNGASGGQTGRLQPAWTTTAGATLTDGSLTLTALAPPAGGEDVIASVSWVQQYAPDATLTITSQSNTSLVASAYIGGGTSGAVYVIFVSVTMASGAVYPAQITMTIL